MRFNRVTYHHDLFVLPFSISDISVSVITIDEPHIACIYIVFKSSHWLRREQEFVGIQQCPLNTENLIYNFVKLYMMIIGCNKEVVHLLVRHQVLRLQTFLSYYLILFEIPL